MEEYQVYVFSRAAELLETRCLLAGSDSIALAKTATLRRFGRFEVWQGDRLVARLYNRGTSGRAAAAAIRTGGRLSPDGVGKPC